MLSYLAESKGASSVVELLGDVDSQRETRWTRSEVVCMYTANVDPPEFLDIFVSRQRSTG